jgi:predicted branched-subunit amino acid permease
MGSFFAGVPVGTELGGLVRDPARWGLDFAFPAVFLALVAAQLRRRGDWLVAIAAGALGVAIAFVLPGNWHIVIAGVTVSAAAAWLSPLPPETASGTPETASGTPETASGTPETAPRTPEAPAP